MIPPEYLHTRLDDAGTVDCAMSAALDRLGFGTSGELSSFFDIVRPDEARLWCSEALASRRIIEVDIELADGSRRRSFTTAATMDSLPTLPDPSSRTRLLSPFDPALRDRNRAERLFGFHYRIEIFVPEAMRRYGYYIFPVLRGDRVIGRIDVKRHGETIKVRAFWPEAGSKVNAHLPALASELERVRHMAGATTVQYEEDWLRVSGPG